jgi:hypothetical protein
MRVVTFILASLLTMSCSRGVPSERAVTISRGPCLGSCPWYSFTLLHDGTYLWEGEYDVARQGLHRGELNSAIFEQVMQALIDARYREFADSYDWDYDCEEKWLDQPSAKITVQLEYDRKEIYHAMGCRGFDREDELFALERLVDELLGSEVFVDGQNIPREKAISIFRSACEGNCSSYNVTLFHDGTYLWEGLEDVSQTGFHRGKYDPAVFEQIMQAFTDARYLELVESRAYPSDCNTTDSARSQLVLLNVQSESELNELFHDTGCNAYERGEDLVELERRIDELLGTKEFIDGR